MLRLTGVYYTRISFLARIKRLRCYITLRSQKNTRFYDGGGIIIFNIRGTGLSTEELKKIVELLPSKEKRKAKEMIAKQMGKPISDYRGLWRVAPKPIDKMSRKEIINNLRKFRDAWEHEQGRNQGLSDEIMADESETNLRKRLSWYFSDTAKNQAANWIRYNQEGGRLNKIYSLS